MAVDNSKLKKQFLVYFAQLPIQKLAAASIGKNEDTITDWKKADSDFSDRVDKARAAWALKNAGEVKSKEWMLERVMNDHFGDKKKVELEGDLKFELVSYDTTTE